MLPSAESSHKCPGVEGRMLTIFSLASQRGNASEKSAEKKHWVCCDVCFQCEIIDHKGTMKHYRNMQSHEIPKLSK